ncbi:MAG: hypothetical protein GDA51_12755 [Ekhidna sp.]|nr:hypothetical protein [Ekhidna sp.]
MKTVVKLWYPIIFIFLSFPVSAQLKFDVNVSDNHLKKVEQTRYDREKLRRYKKYYRKDSIKAVKKAWKNYRKENKDSLIQMRKWKELKTRKVEFIKGEWDLKPAKEYLANTTLFDPPEDAVDRALQELAGTGDFESLQGIYELYGQYDSAYLDRFDKDSLKLDPKTLADRFDMKDRVKQYLPTEFKRETDLSIKDQMKYGELDRLGDLQKVDRSGVAAFFSKVDPKEFVRLPVTMKAAKKKYDVLPDLSKEEEGIKRNSLKGKSWKKRLFLNGNIAIQSTLPLILDFNVQLGYYWSRKLSGGVGLLYRERFKERDSASIVISGDSHGYSFFISYDVAKVLFLYGEAQSVINEPLIGETKNKGTWQHAYLLGAGRRFNLSKRVILSTMLLYDLNYKNNTLSRRSLMPRIGYSLMF